MLAIFAQECQEGFIPPDYRLLINLEQLIEKDFKFRQDVTYYVDQLCITAKCMNNITCRYRRKTVKSLIMHRVMKEACYMLRYTCMSIKQIALELGMDQGYFNRFFASQIRSHRLGIAILKKIYHE